MLAGPLLLSRHLALFTLRGLMVERRLPRAVCAGDLLVVHLAISNTRRRVGSWILVLEEPIRRLTGGRGPAVSRGRRAADGDAACPAPHPVWSVGRREPPRASGGIYPSWMALTSSSRTARTR